MVEHDPAPERWCVGSATGASCEPEEEEKTQNSQCEDGASDEDGNTERPKRTPRRSQLSWFRPWPGFSFDLISLGLHRLVTSPCRGSGSEDPAGGSRWDPSREVESPRSARCPRCPWRLWHILGAGRARSNRDCR